MENPEIQFRAEAAVPLGDAIRSALGSGGRPPSRRRVAAWIAGGRVRVDEAVVTDPRARVPEGARIDLRGGDEEAAAPASGPEAPPPPLEILHLDRHLLVVEHEPLAAGAAPLAERLEACLEAVGVGGLAPRPVPAPEPRAGGVLTAALSAAAACALAEAFEEGRAHLRAEALVAPAAPGADPEDLEVLGEADGALHVRLPPLASLGAAAAFLATRDLEIVAAPGPGPAARRPLRLHAVEVRLVHPRTGRRLAFVSRFPRPAGSL